MTKVLYGITKSNWGGAQRYVFDLATAAKAQGSDVTVAFGGNGELAARLRGAGTRTIPVEALGRDIGVADLSAYWAISRVIRKERPDVLHLNSSKVGVLGGLAGRAHGIRKIVFTAHGWPFKEPRSFLSRAIIWLGSWLTVACAHVVIVVSDSELELAKRIPGAIKKTVRIYNGIDINMHFSDGAIIRSAFPTGVHIIGTVGELTYNKNQIALIEEARIKLDMYVAIVGEGELREFLEQKIAEYGLQNRVKLFGFLPAQQALKGFDTFALPSIKEGLPYVLLEARAAGLPIVANLVGGIPEIVEKPITEFTLDRMVKQTLDLYR